MKLCREVPGQGCEMLGILSLALLLAGAAMAYASRLYPARRRLLESGGGWLLVSGLIMLGFAFPFSG
jgi:hypothetical protein